MTIEWVKINPLFHGEPDESARKERLQNRIEMGKQLEKLNKNASAAPIIHDTQFAGSSNRAVTPSSTPATPRNPSGQVNVPV